MSLPNLISLGGYELTDQGRTLSIARDERSIAVELAAGLTKKYFKAVKYSFSLKWTQLPSLSTQTYDRKEARNTLKVLSDTQTVLPLIVRAPIGTTQTYNVWIESYSEDILRRDYISNAIFYEVSLELKEQ
jgi:hypothetical protein